MLILNYRFKNFYSFAEEVSVDFTATKSKANAYTVDRCGKYINRVAAFYGANGAGKTNALKALAFMDWFTTKSFHDVDAEDDIPLDTHALNKNEPFEFEIEYCHDDELYRYRLIIHQNKVVRESLHKRSSETKKYITLFTRSKTEDGYKLSTPNLDLPKQLHAFDRPNCSLISYFLATEPVRKQFKSDNYKFKGVVFAFHAFLQINTNINSQGKKERTGSDLLALSETLSENDSILNTYEAFIKALDIGIDGLQLKPMVVLDGNEKSKEVPVLFAKHTCEDGSSFELPIFDESTGTKKILVCLSNLLPALIDGNIAVVDELDSDLHPYMLPFLLDVFSNKEASKRPGQLLFSAHTSEAMNEISKSQIFLVEKINQSSEIYRADQVQGLRSQDNLYRKYISGALGGIPELDSSELNISALQKETENNAS